jgi:hypothetical protein
MSTQCGIAIKTEKGYETIYCHQDGYPGYMWPMLTDNYNSEELAAKLISFGYASYIDKKLEPTSDFHRFGMPEPDVCMFYHRDRGEDWISNRPQAYTKRQLFNNYYYSYVWEDGCWNFYQGGRKVY